MKTLWKRALSGALAVAVMATAAPGVLAYAAEAQTRENADNLELSDGYLSVSMSTENGGFLVNTEEGDKLNKSDNNKNLLYPAADYDTSYTSVRVTRTDGSTEDYVFGRDYGFFGLDSSDVEVSKEGNTLKAQWSVKDLTMVQTLSLLDQNSAQHGMVSISYQVSTDRDDVENVKLRLMLDTALGYQDWATYELPGVNGIYQHITSEQVLDNRDGQAYSGTMFAVDDANAPSMTAYTVNASLDGQTVEPYQLAFGHWNNLAETSFDFTPDLGLDFTNPYNETYLTADSAYALYYDLGQITPDDSAVMSTYYGVYSNVTVGEEERAAINFPELPASMTFNEEQDAYLSQVEGGAEGDVHLQVSVSNISDDAVSQMAVVTRVRNGVQPYEDYYEGLLYEGGAREDFYQVVRDFQPGEEAQVEFYYNVSPLPVSEYRKLEILCYDISDTGELLEQNLLASREFYVLCPGVLGEILTFHSLNPQIIYTDGTRHLFLSGQNFQLLQNTSAYTVYLKSLSGGTDLVLDSSKVFLDMDKNSLDLVVDQHLDPGGYQVVFNWAEAGKEPTTSSALQFSVTEEPEYISDVYGVVTIEKDGEDGYALRLYDDETSYDRSLTDMEKQNQVLLEFRGDFTAQYDEDGNLVSASAVSVEAADGTVSSTINISNCLDVEAGSLTIRVENPGTEEQVINTDIDGKVYTTNSRTKVWNGVCAITSLENGEEYPLLQYDYMGNPTSDVENSVANTNAITLVWPGAASTAQTLAGILFEFRYCQFGLMALETGTVTDQTPKKRVVAFGAEMSPDFLLPSNFDWGNRQTSTLEAVQLNLAKSNYTADQLRDVQARYAADQQAWEEAETGSLSLYVHDILFGGGFVGFNASVEVALPSYADGLPGVEGTLNLRVMPDRDLWEVGVYGSADFAILNMEAELVITAYNNIPLPNKIYFYVGGFTPGINVDGMGIFWIQGAGGGVEGLADTVFLSSRVPPLKLIFSGQFALFAVLQARADLTMGMREFSLGMRDLNIAGITLLESASLTTQWYPELRLNAGIELNILDIIEGSGSIVLEEDKRENRLFWEGFATAGVTTPKIPLIGEIHIGDVDLGLNASKIWGALHVLMLDMGVTYYWGGDVDFAFGKYNTPEATVPAALSGIPVYTDAGTGRVLYMSVGTNARLEAATDRRTFDLAGTATRTNGESSIDRSADGMTHVIQLGSYSGASGKALTLSFQADSLEQAQRIAMGDSRYGTPGITLTDPDDPGQTYSLRWLDTTQDAEEQSDANALLSYDQESGEANVTISFTQAEDYHAWRLTLGASAQSALYDIAYLPGLDSASVQWNDQTQELTVTWQGSELNDVENVAVYAVSQTEEGESTTTLLYETDDTGIISGGVAGATQGSATFAVPTDLPSGSYTIQVVGSSETRSVNDVVKVEEPLAYTNPNQPQAPVIDSVKLGGDYSIDVAVEKQGAYDGYVATIYEQTDTGLVATDLAQQWVETSGEAPEETLTLGGRYTTSAYVDGDGNAVLPSEAEGRDDVTSVEQTVGVEAGKVYKIGLAGYTTGPNGEIFLSQETLSSAITMQAPQKATVTVQAEGSVSVDGTDTINGVNATIQITSDMPVSGTWTLDGDVASGQWQAGTDQNFLDQAIDFFANLFGGEREQIGTIYLSGRAETDVLPDDGGLTEGTHILSLVGENEQGDAVSVKYLFRVDTTAPRLQLISPADGDYFSDTVTVEGLSEPGAVVTVLVDGQAAQTVTIPEDGTLSVEIPVDNTVLEHELTIYAEDAVGNVGRKMSIPLLNDIAAAPDVALGILFNGQDYTQQNIPAGTNGVVQLCLVSGSRRVPVPADSVMGRQAEWQTTVVKGTASLDNGLSLLTSPDVNGMLTVSLDQMQAAAVLGGNANDIDYQTCNVTVTANEGGTVSPAGTTAVTEGESFTLTITPDAYYHVESVVVNGETVTVTDNTYTLDSVTSETTIEVTFAPDVTRDDLQALVDAADGKVGEWYTSGWDAYAKAIADATELLKEENPSVSALGEAKTAIETALAALAEREQYTTEDPFYFPNEKGVSVTLEAEFAQLHNVELASDGQWALCVAEADWASHGEFINCLNQQDTISFPYEAKTAGTYTVTATYRSGDTNNSLAWSEPDGKIASGTVSAGAGDSATQTHTVTFEIEITEAGAGTLVFTGPDKKSPQLDKLVIELKEAAEPQPVEYTVTVNTQGEGTATAEPTTATAGTTVTLTQAAAEGWHFVEWQSETVTVTDNTFVMPEGNVTVTAVFEKDETPEPGDVDKTLLEKTVAYAEGLDTTGVTDTAKKAFEDALANAKAVLAKADATQDEVNAAWDQLLEGIWGLGLVQGDKDELNKLIAKAEDMMANADKYVEENWQQLVDALAAAKDVAADGDAMDEDIKPVAQALLDAILAQRFKADKSILEDLIGKAEGMDLTGYTAESVATFRTALATAQNVMADATLSVDDQKVVDDAVAALQSAMDGLTAGGAPETTDKPESTDKPQATEKPAEKPAQTGDSAQLMLYVAALGAAVVALSTATVVRKRRGN